MSAEFADAVRAVISAQALSFHWSVCLRYIEVSHYYLGADSGRCHRHLPWQSPQETNSVDLTLQFHIRGRDDCGVHLMVPIFADLTFRHICLFPRQCYARAGCTGLSSRNFGLTGCHLRLTPTQIFLH